MEGSIPAGGPMKLHTDHAFTRASGALLTHVIKLLAVFWHVFKGVKPTAAFSAAGLISGALAAVPIASAPIGGGGGVSTNSLPVITTTTTTTSQIKSKPIFGFQFVQTTEVEGEPIAFILH